MSAILFNQEETDITIVGSTQEINDDYYTNSARTCSQICEELLSDKMNSLELNETVTGQLHVHNNCDGSDSGVDIATNVSVTLQRALSSNSGGDETNVQGHGNVSCNSSLLSCSSDLYEMKVQSVPVSQPLPPTTRSPNSFECFSENGSESSSVVDGRTTTQNAAMARRSNSVKKKVAMFEPLLKKVAIFESPNVALQQQTRPRTSGLKRAVSLPRPSQAALQFQAREKTSSRAHNSITTPSSFRVPTVAPTSATTTPSRHSSRPQKPDTLPNTLSRTQSISMQRLVQRTPSLSRARTPGTPSDDGRWPTVTHTTRSNATRRGLSVTPDLSSLKMRSSALGISMDSQKPATSSNYGTLPRRRKQQSVEDLTAVSGRGSRSSSITRDSRMTSSVVVSSRRNLMTTQGVSSAAGTPTQPYKTLLQSSATSKSGTVHRKPQTKTRIYHETGVQTALTSDDLDKVFSGCSLSSARAIDAIDRRDQASQSDIRDRELERLRDEVRHLTKREHELSAKLQREREEKLMMQRELHVNTERVMGMLEMARFVGASTGTPTSDDGGEGGSGHDSLLMLESQIQMSGHELIERQQEIGQLRQMCRSLQMEMQRSIVTQECLLQEKAAIEQESNELQDFLQHEKAAMCEALKEIEADYQSSKQQLANREEEVKVLRDECRHLVRLNEQRRQENRLLQTKYAALETKSKELMFQQNASVSGASSALSGLHTRLDSLVEQLVYSYSISEQDLEDIGFQNETLTNGCSGDNSHENENPTSKTANGLELPLQPHNNPLALSSDGSLSPQRNQSFIAAVISAIRNATTHSGKRLLVRNGKRSHGAHTAQHTNQHTQQHSQQTTHNNGNEQSLSSMANGGGGGGDSDSTEMLDSETEPCLMMDNVLEDVVHHDSHSHNMVSSCTGMISQIEIPSELVNVTIGDDSLQQLSQAITNRQQLEAHMKLALPSGTRDQCNTEDLSCHDSLAEMPSLMEYSITQAVVDQVIEVDNLVTKLLKVLRLIQLDNDNCIQQLIVDKNKLQEHKEDMLEKLKDLEDVNLKLQDELMDATQELMLKGSDLSSTKAEMQRHRNEIDVRF